MAWASTNDDFMTGFDEATGTISVPLTSFPQLTSAEAQGTADARPCIFAFVDQWFSVFNALAAADKSTKMTITKAQAMAADDTISRTYSFTFKLDPTGLEVKAE